MNNNSIIVKENVLAGAVGAFLFSLVGGILWFVLFQIGYVASISGLIGVVCAVKGYTFFAKTKDESIKCLVISIITTVIVLLISWYFCVAYDIFLAYQEWFAAGEIDYAPTFFECVRAVPFFFEDSEILVGYLKDLGVGIFFAVLGVIYYLSSREKKLKKKAAEAAASEAKAINQDTTEEVEQDTNEQ